MIQEFVSNFGFDASTPGFALLIQRSDQVLSENTVGIKNKNKAPITLESQFRLASLTKQFTAVAVLQLTEKSRLSLESKLADVLEGFPAYGKDITIRHLLTHTSGLPDYEPLVSQGYSSYFKDQDVLDILETQSSSYFKPGSAYRYSNSAYCLLSLIVERTSGMSFSEYMKVNVFSPAGMTTAAIAPPYNMSDRVYGYSREGGEWRLNDQSRTSTTQGDGGVYASVKDLANWQKYLYKDRSVINADSLKQMTTRHISTNRAGEDYGFGIAISKIADTECYLHHGTTSGFENAMFYEPEYDTSLILLSNASGTGFDAVAAGKALLADYFKD